MLVEIIFAFLISETTCSNLSSQTNDYPTQDANGHPLIDYVAFQVEPSLTVPECHSEDLFINGNQTSIFAPKSPKSPKYSKQEVRARLCKNKKWVEMNPEVLNDGKFVRFDGKKYDNTYTPTAPQTLVPEVEEFDYMPNITFVPHEFHVEEEKMVTEEPAPRRTRTHRRAALEPRQPLNTPMQPMSAFKPILKKMPNKTKRVFCGNFFNGERQIFLSGKYPLMYPANKTKKLPEVDFRSITNYDEDTFENIEEGCILPSFQTRFGNF